VAFVLIVVLGIGVLAGGWYLQSQARQRRMAAVATIGSRIGFTFSASDVEGLRDLPFSLFDRGSRRQLTNVLYGTHNGVPTHFFDYAYYVSEGRSGRWYRYTCALATVPAACPSFALGYESFFSRVAEHVGMHDVQLESDDFNRRFRVQCRDQRFAFSLLDGAMMEWLLESKQFQSLEIDGPFILAVFPQLDPSQWLSMGAWLDQFHAHVPEVVYSTYPPQ
jgi:hypothetical protein